MNDDWLLVTIIYSLFRLCKLSKITTFAKNQQKYYESYRYLGNNNKNANNKRRLAQMYQQLLRGGGKDYTEKDITEIYNYVIEENQKYERKKKKNK